MVTDEAAAALARLREEMIEAVNVVVPALDGPTAYGVGALHVQGLKALDILDAMLAAHPLTATVRRCTVPCPAHEYRGILARRDCPDCVKAEYQGCRECRDEFGDPVRPADCRPRKEILAALARKDKADG